MVDGGLIAGKKGSALGLDKAARERPWHIKEDDNMNLGESSDDSDD